MNTFKELIQRLRAARIIAALMLGAILLTIGCRSFDYTDSDLERERQQLKQGGTYQPGNF